MREQLSILRPQRREGVNSSIWQEVGRLAARAKSVDDLRLHRIHLVAARHWRSIGAIAPPELARDERESAMSGLAAAFLLQRVRDAYDGRIVLMKGLEVGTYYPDPSLRPFRDLDLMVDDPALAQRALLAAGFELTGDERRYRDIHHLQPLRLSGLPLVLEIHDRPKWLDWENGPDKAELFEAAVPSRTSVAGVDTLLPAHHVVVLAIHSWAHSPLARIGHLLDVAALQESLQRSAVDSVASAWGVDRVWRATAAAADGLFRCGGAPISIRTWARNLVAVRERNVVERHLERWLEPFWSRRPFVAVQASVTALRSDVLPADGELWRVKRARALQALRAPRRPLSEHREALEQGSMAAPSFLDRMDSAESEAEDFSMRQRCDEPS